MTIGKEIKYIRQKSFLSQSDFAKELNVSFNTVNRWENDRTLPNNTAMRNLQGFCKANDINFTAVQNEWLKEKG